MWSNYYESWHLINAFQMSDLTVASAVIQQIHWMDAVHV